MRRLKPGARVAGFVDRLDENAVGTVICDTGHTLEVPGVLPAEKVSVEVTHVTGSGRAFGKLVFVHERSPHRVDVPCPHFTRCGGCDFLHVDRKFELQWKREQLETALGVSVEPTLAPSSELAYRALAKLVVGEEGAKLTLGSYRPRTHDVIDMRGCRVHMPSIESLAELLRGQLSPDCRARYVIVRASLAHDELIVTVVTEALASPAARAFAEVAATHPRVRRVLLHENARDDDVLVGSGKTEVIVDRGPVFESLGAATIELRGASFAQVNPAAAAEVYARIVRGLSGTHVADLYSGAGGIALALAKQGRHVQAVEADPEGVEALVVSAARLGVSDRLVAHASRVEDAIEKLEPFEAAVLNPPRKGVARAVLENLAGRGTISLAYMSCNPKTLARDLDVLRSLASLDVHSVTPIDMFPKTRHVETLVLAAIAPRKS